MHRGPANGSLGLVPNPSSSSSVMAASAASVGRCSPRPQTSASRRRRCRSVDRDRVPGAPHSGQVGPVQIRAENVQQLPLDAGRPPVESGVGPAPLGVAPEDLLEGVGELVGQLAVPALAQILPFKASQAGAVELGHAADRLVAGEQPALGDQLVQVALHEAGVVLLNVAEVSAPPPRPGATDADLIGRGRVVLDEQHLLNGLHTTGDPVTADPAG